MYELNQHIELAIAALDQGAIEEARAEFALFDQGWFEIEHDIRDAAPEHYKQIEDATGDARYLLKQEPVDLAETSAALQTLAAANEAFIDTAGSALINAARVETPSPATSIQRNLVIALIGGAVILTLVAVVLVVRRNLRQINPSS